ncbi:MAG: MltA domain-containing protein [Thermoanaerobaculia bacterium]|nr:MltA domain-containing protein [Thermoanaerobaculia bacterium]
MRRSFGPAARWRVSALVLLGLFVLLGSGLVVLWDEGIYRDLTDPLPVARYRPPPEPLLPRMRLVETVHDRLPGWSEDSLAEAVPALERSCSVWTARSRDHPVGRDGWAGRVGDWLPLCRRVESIRPTEIRGLLEESTRAWEVWNRDDATGLFTGYYEPLLHGSRTRGGRYQVPLHVRPPDLVTVDLGRFRQDLEGRRIAGRLRGRSLVPFPDRAAIRTGALAGRGLELVWVDDPVDAFFLQVQGSGRVRLPDGREVRLGYAAQNGHPYHSIGRELIDRGELSREEVSLQSIRRWLRNHPEEAEKVMNTNASYVFFRRLEGPGPLGSLGVPVTPERSLAVDERFHPLGAPVWVDTVVPKPGETGGEEPFRRLLVAQDTGGAIRGPVRGDIFWGHGGRAEQIAGRMKGEGRLWLLLPRTVEPPRTLALPGEASDE